jgi:deoxyribodipyrimidine photo-lyase
LRQKATMPVSIWWIRRDLRLNNNYALMAAQKSGYPVLPVFILDDHLIKEAANRRQRFLISGLSGLQTQLRQLGSDLVIRKGDPFFELQKLVQETAAFMIFAEEDFSPFARQRDDQVKRVLPLTLLNGLTNFHPNAVLKPDGAPYTVFTPFNKKWRSLPALYIHSEPKTEFVKSANLPNSVPLPQVIPVDAFPAGEPEADKRIANFINKRVADYSDHRNRMDLNGTSMLSPYVRFGMISVNQIVNNLLNILEKTPDNQGCSTWMDEFIWREFFQSVLFHFPRVKEEAFNPKFCRIVWRNSPADLQTWKVGLTGYPVVDAAMRQLASTGWMHNRARMITASFLTKDLLINWQEGERWFLDQLVDGDIASNNGGWQWAAGTGTDAAPYFRIFNPILQSKKFDPSGEYIRRWVPELLTLPAEWIHEPWTMPEKIQKNFGVYIGKTYPAPIVDHGIAKIRTLAAYQAAGR